MNKDREKKKEIKKNIFDKAARMCNDCKFFENNRYCSVYETSIIHHDFYPCSFYRERVD